MPKTAVYNMEGKAIGEIELSEEIFAAPINEAAMHLMVRGGVVFAPKPRDYDLAVNKKVRRVAFKSAMTAKLNAGEIIVVDKIELKEAKTKLMAAALKALQAEKKALVVLPERDENVIRATANLAGAKVSYVNTLNVYDILNAGKLVLAKSAVAGVEEVYA